MVTITLARLESWAAKRSVADAMLKDRAVDLSKAMSVLRELRDANGQCIDGIGLMRQENDALRAALRDAQDRANAAEGKVMKLRPWATLGKGTIVIGAAAGGFLIYNALRP